MAEEPTTTRSLQEQRPTPAHTPKFWWAAKRTQAAYFVAENAGLLLVICSQFVFASTNLSVKLLQSLDPPTPTLELMTLRMVMTAWCCVVYMVANRISDPIFGPKGVRGLLLARALAGFLGIFGMYYSLNYLSVADATVITFLGPFSVALAGHLLLGETCTKNEAIAGACGLVGVVLIARPTLLFGNSMEGEGGSGVTSFERLRAVGVALVGVGGNTGTFITMRAIGKRAHPMHIMTFFSIFCVIVGSAAMATMRESLVFPMTWRWITLLLLVGCLSITGQLLLTLGIRYETATRSSLGLYCQLLFATILQFVVFGTVPSSMSAGGTAIIMAAQAYVFLSKRKPTSQPSVAASAVSSDGAEERLLYSVSEDTPLDAEYSPGKVGAREAPW